jgi:hypothetical protein
VLCAIHDTFLAFPRSGISRNFGAFNLSAAESLFAQSSSQELVAEARLAQELATATSRSIWEPSPIPSPLSPFAA